MKRKFTITGWLEYNPEQYAGNVAIEHMLQEAANQLHDKAMPASMEYGLIDIEVSYSKTPMSPD